MSDIETIQDELYNVVLTLEEMILFHEGKMPARVMDFQRENGYAEARKLVLNEARSQLRRAKTIMLRTEIVHNKPAATETTPGLVVSTVEKGAAPEAEADQPAPLPAQRSFAWKILASLTLLATFLIGFWVPAFHTGIAAVFTIVLVTLLAYWAIVGVRFE